MNSDENRTTTFGQVPVGGEFYGEGTDTKFKKESYNECIVVEGPGKGRTFPVYDPGWIVEPAIIEL